MVDSSSTSTALSAECERAQWSGTWPSDLERMSGRSSTEPRCEPMEEAGERDLKGVMSPMRWFAADRRNTGEGGGVGPVEPSRGQPSSLVAESRRTREALCWSLARRPPTDPKAEDWTPAMLVMLGSLDQRHVGSLGHGREKERYLGEKAASPSPESTEPLRELSHPDSSGPSLPLLSCPSADRKNRLRRELRKTMLEQDRDV